MSGARRQRTDARNPALEAARYERPNDAQAALAHAAWLEDQGDVRGRLIRVQHALSGEKTLSGRRKLIEEEARLFQDHTEALLGPKRVLEFFEPEWCLGFIRRAVAARPALTPHTASAHRLGMLLRHPSGRFVEELELLLRDVPNFQDLLGLLMFQRPFGLRRLIVKVAGRPNLVRFAEGFNHLVHLELEASSLALGQVRLPRLETLTLSARGADDDFWTSVRTADVPLLRTLSVDLSRAGKPQPVPLGPLERVLDGELSPHLRYLTLRGLALDAAFYRRLAMSRALKTLHRLDLSGSACSPASATLLMQHGAAFKHLARLDLWGSELPDSAVKKLKTLGAGVRVSYA